jgi:uncharacterized membrane protein
VAGFEEIISLAGYAVEAAGVLVIIAGCVLATFSYARAALSNPGSAGYRAYRRQVGRSIILGLEFLIAGDIIRTVVIADTLMNIAALALIIVIRTFLSATLHLEIEGRWPWQPAPETDP